MDIIFRDILNEEEAHALQELVASCNKHDGTGYSAPADADLFFLCFEEEPHMNPALCAALCVYRLGATEDGKAESELYAFTIPRKRRQGIFLSLLDRARPLLSPVLYFPVYEEPVGKAGDITSPGPAVSALKHIGAEKKYDEFFLSLDLTELGPGCPAREKAVPAHTPRKDERPGGRSQASGPAVSEEVRKEALSEGGFFFSSKYCECMTAPYNADTVYLYAVLTYERYRSRGYGYRFLMQVLSLLAGDYREAVLQVSSENTAALGLYKKCGFHKKEALSFYRLKNA